MFEQLGNQHQHVPLHSQLLLLKCAVDVASRWLPLPLAFFGNKICITIFPNGRGQILCPGLPVLLNNYRAGKQTPTPLTYEGACRLRIRV